MKHPNQIVEAVCSVFEVEREELCGPARERTVSTPRQIAAYLIKKEGLLTYKQLAAMFNRQDHTTVRYWVKTVEANLESRPWVARLVAEVEQALETPVITETPALSPESVA